MLSRLQSVLNGAARSIADLRRSTHITDTLASFHWLRATERVKFKLAVIVYQALHCTAPRYLTDVLRPVADMPSRRRLRSSTSVASLMSVRRVWSLWVIDRLLPLVRGSGTVFRTTSHLLHHCLCSGKKNLKRIYFGNRTRTLLCSLFVIYIATVVLEVYFT